MRPSLLKSFLVVVIVWFVVTALAWALGDPDTNLANLRALARLAPWHDFQVPERAHALNALGIQSQVLSYWTVPVLAATVVVALLGYGTVWLFGYRKHKEREHRERSQGSYRGITSSLGRLPLPPTLPRAQVELGAPAATLERLTVAEKSCLSEILGLASAHPHTYSGDPAQPFVERTLAVADSALQSSARPGLSAIVAAAYELGRITAYKRSDTGEWALGKPLGREAARHLTALPAWWRLPHNERMAVLLAVKYRDCPAFMPNPGDASYELAKTLIASAPALQGQVASTSAPAPVEHPLARPIAAAPVADEPDNRPVSEQLFSHFMRFLPQLPFQSPGQPKSVPAVGWKVGRRLYLLENALRNSLTQRLSPALKATLEAGDYAKKTKLPPMTYELIAAFEARGLLVREIGKAKVDLAQPFWKISAGVKDFQRVLILDASEEMLPMLPPQDSYYAVTVLGPQFTQPGTYAMSAADLSSLLK